VPNFLSNPINAWMEAASFSADTQTVIARRLMRFTEGGPGTNEEAQQMVLEKLSAFAESCQAMGFALATGKPWNVAANAAYLPYKRRVAENSERLADKRR